MHGRLPFKVLTSGLPSLGILLLLHVRLSEHCTDWEVASLSVYVPTRVASEILEHCVYDRRRQTGSLHVPAETLTEACVFVRLVVGGRRCSLLIGRVEGYYPGVI